MNWTGAVPAPGDQAPKIVSVTNGAEFRGVITDWGGVLTTPILHTVQAWIEADGIDWDRYRTVMRTWVTDAYGPNGTRNPIHALERGECSDTEFEQALAAELRTALLSNSWGATEYPRADFPTLFDAVVISSECGMRKPEAEIFRHAADLLGLRPEQCIFIDDIEANITAAQACGMTGVHHVEAAQTAAALEDLLGIPLGETRPAGTGLAGTDPAGTDPADPTGNTMR